MQKSFHYTVGFHQELLKDPVRNSLHDEHLEILLEILLQLFYQVICRRFSFSLIGEPKLTPAESGWKLRFSPHEATPYFGQKWITITLHSIYISASNQRLGAISVKHIYKCPIFKLQSNWTVLSFPFRKCDSISSTFSFIALN